MSEDLKFTEPRPKQRYDTRLYNLGIKIETADYVRWRLEKRHYENFNSVPKQVRQEILDLFSSGKSIHDICYLVGLEADVVADVIYFNLEIRSELRSETL
jgi:hypothetical protein